jgi:hypothetical protein
MFFVTVLSGCEKHEILEHNTVYGEATINDRQLLHYMKFREGLSNQYWYLPLNGIGNTFIVKEGVCYLQIFLRDYEGNDTENFWLILIGCHADESFPIIGKEYKIAIQNQVKLGNIYIALSTVVWNLEISIITTLRLNLTGSLD